MTRTQRLLGMFAATAICLPALAQTGSDNDGDQNQTQNRPSQNQTEQNQTERNSSQSSNQDSNWLDTRNRQDRRSRQSNDRNRSQMQRQGMNERGMKQNQRSETKKSSTTLSGTIRSMKQFDLTGVKGKRSIARVQIKDGSHVAVLLGPTAQVSNFDLGEGDQLTIGVQQGSVDGRHVFVAESIRSGDRTYRVENRKVDDLKRISGQIVSTRTRELNSRNDNATEHKLVKVKESSGRTYVVSLGPISKTNQMPISKGDKFCVLGSPTKVNGHTVYNARRVSHNGKTKNLVSTSKRSSEMKSSQTLTGTIRSMKDFVLTDVDGKRRIARLETESGNHVAVILGPTTQVGNFDLSQGDQVTVQVKQGSIDGRHVFVADRVRSGDRTHRVENGKVDDLKRISGEIVSTKTRELNCDKGNPTQHNLVKVMAPNGRTCVVTLGPISENDKKRLSEGEKVCVLASPTKVNGHTVYCARRVSHDGQTRNLASAGSSMNRSASRE